jgi:hypothetical protein
MDDLEGRVVPMRHKLIGPSDSARWLSARGLRAAPGERWATTIVLDDDALAPTWQLQIAIEALEWSFCLTHENKMSWIRVLDVPRIQERDDFDLLSQSPALRNLAALVQWIEDRLQTRFRRAHARIRTTLPDAHAKIRLWVAASL